MGQAPMAHGMMDRSAMVSSGSSAGLTEQKCRMAAQSANVLPDALEKADSTALDAVRRVLEARLSTGGTLSDPSTLMLAFFDRGTSAAKEARLAHDAGQSAGPSAPSMSNQQTNLDDVRTHRSLDALYQFGRSLGTTQTGSEAQALAWIIAVDRFMAVKQLPEQQKPLAAEPLFRGVLGVSPPPAAPGRMASDWNQYLAATARSLGATANAESPRGIGGGPSSSTKNASMTQITQTSQERLRVLQQQLPASSDFRDELERTMMKLRTFELQIEPSPSTIPPQRTQ